MISVAVLGTGTMGRPIAANLIAAGFRVTVWNRSGRDMWTSTSGSPPSSDSRRLDAAELGGGRRIVGFRRPNQVDPLVAAASLELSTDDLALIRAA